MNSEQLSMIKLRFPVIIHQVSELHLRAPVVMVTSVGGDHHVSGKHLGAADSIAFRK